jgi:glycosyltransferase involved in cell wall biosynthesis
MKKISIITPVFNEEENVTELCDRIINVMKKLQYEYEHICIDNFSNDDTLKLLRERAIKDKNLKIIVNTRNFGYIRSSYHALLQSSGDATVLIASDLQDPPEMIEEFIRIWETGYKTVMAVKPESEENKIIFLLRKVYYKWIEKISEIQLIKNATGSGLFDRKIIEILRDIQEPYPYFRGLVCEIGYPIATVPFKQPLRKRGITSQNFYSLYDMAILGVTKHSRIPLRLITISGFLISFTSIIVAITYLIAKLLFWNSFEIGLAPILIGLFLLGGTIVFFLGLIGEYISTILIQIRNLPHVIESERINF